MITLTRYIWLRYSTPAKVSCNGGQYCGGWEGEDSNARCTIARIASAIFDIEKPVKLTQKSSRTLLMCPTCVDIGANYRSETVEVVQAAKSRPRPDGRSPCPKSDGRIDQLLRMTRMTELVAWQLVEIATKVKKHDQMPKYARSGSYIVATVASEAFGDLFIWRVL